MEKEVPNDWDHNVTLETRRSILRLDELALRVTDALHLNNNSDFMLQGEVPRNTEGTLQSGGLSISIPSVWPTCQNCALA